MRFYLHFCNKYGHQPGDLGSLPLFIAKLASKGQTVEQQAEAQRAIGYYRAPLSPSIEPRGKAQSETMNEETWKKAIEDYSTKELSQRKAWYSGVAAVYDRLRPGYSSTLIDQVLEITQLSPGSNLLEIGAGPGTATVSFAPLGCSMLCLEPNSDFYQLAQRNCQAYPNVKIHNTSFEEWELEPEEFDAILSATAFHWIPAEIRFLKAAQALRDRGYLILLWNTGLEPEPEIQAELQNIYQDYVPDFVPYEGLATQQQHLQSFGQMILDSGYFQNLVSQAYVCTAHYAITDYLLLLSTYSPYLNLETQAREALFASLKTKLEQQGPGQIKLYYLSAFHIAEKVYSCHGSS